MAIDDWAFTPAEIRYGIYVVRGIYRHARMLSGHESADGYGVDAMGLPISPVEGVGKTPQEARDHAIYAAGEDDRRRADAVRAAHIAVMRGRM